MEFSRRKWGWYWTLYSAENFKIKLLWFRKGGQCSMQRHRKRSELWCLIFGNGELRYGGYTHESRPFYSGETYWVTMGSWHQYIAGKTSLVLEVQTGECREDDIERAA